MGESLSLNIGCGDHYADGWVNTDLHDDQPGGPRPDVVCSILDLPFPDHSVERIYCGHVLEHVALDDMPRALGELRRVIKADGVLIAVGPDVNLTEVHEPLLLDGVKYGGHRWPGDEHAWVATGEQTLALITAAGFDARLLPVSDVPEEWPVVARVPWQFAIEAQKERQ